jgi:hypothetical protein
MVPWTWWMEFVYPMHEISCEFHELWHLQWVQKDFRITCDMVQSEMNYQKWDSRRSIWGHKQIGRYHGLHLGDCVRSIECYWICGNYQTIWLEGIEIVRPPQNIVQRPTCTLLRRWQSNPSSIERTLDSLITPTEATVEQCITIEHPCFKNMGSSTHSSWLLHYSFFNEMVEMLCNIPG